MAAAEPPGPRAASRSPALGPSRSGGERRRNARDATQDAPLRSADLNHVITLLKDSGSKDLEEEQLKTLKKVVKQFENGLTFKFQLVTVDRGEKNLHITRPFQNLDEKPLKNVVQITEILNLCAEKVNEQEAFTEPLCELIKLFGLPFQKKKSSDELNYSVEVSQSIAQLGYLMRVPSSQVKIQICKSIVSFYNIELPGKLLSGYQPTSANYKIRMAEEGGLAEALVLSLALVENQLIEKLWVLKALQHLSTSGISCRQMVKAQAASRLCLYLNGADPSGQLVFRSSDILWSLLENASKEEVVNQLSSLECVHTLKEVFADLVTRGFRHCDHQLRNDLLVIATLLAENPAVPMIESGFAKLLIVLATFTEVKLPNPLVKGFKLTYSYEDFEMKKLLFNVIGILSGDPSAARLLSENHVMPALLYYVKLNHLKPGFPGWSAAQYEELQLHAIAVLASVAPVLVDKYLSCQANTLLLVFLEWCTGQDPFVGRGHSFHGTGGRGNKLAQMRYGLRVLRSVVALYDDAVSINLCDQGAISQLLDILKYAADKSKEKEGTVLLEIQADILFILSVLCENDIHRKELFSCEGIDLLIPFFTMDPKKLYSGLGHHCLLLSALDCLWSCVIGCHIAEVSFIEKEGIFLLLDLLALKEKNLCNIILGILVEFSDNPKTTVHMSVWRGKRDQTAANLLIQLWRQEELDLGVRRDKHGKIVDTKRPIVTSFQKLQKVIPVPASCPSFAIMEVAESIRAKVYSLFCKLENKPLPLKCSILAYRMIGRLTEPFISKDFSTECIMEKQKFFINKGLLRIKSFENLPGLSAKDFVTLAIIQRYIDFKIGEVWSEICAEIKEEFRPVTSDERALKVISNILENTGEVVVALQTEVLQTERQRKIQEDEETYKEIQASQTQTELLNKSWENFLTRTSNYEALKEAKMLQEELIDASRFKAKIQNGSVYSTDIPKLNITGEDLTRKYLHGSTMNISITVDKNKEKVGPGRFITVDSTLCQQSGGPLADTEHAPRKSSVCKRALKKVQKR